MAASSSQNVSLDRVLLEITSTNNLGALNQTLRGFAPKDVRESLLASSLPNGQDPLAVLEIERHTLGALYILYVLDLNLSISVFLFNLWHYLGLRASWFRRTVTCCLHLTTLSNSVAPLTLARPCGLPIAVCIRISAVITMLNKQLVNIVAKGLVALAEGLNSVSNHIFSYLMQFHSVWQPKLPLTCLYHIVHRYAPSPAHLTPIHPLFISVSYVLT